MMILWKLFSVFLKIGAFSFGGGYAMIPFIQKEIVQKNAWIEIDQFIDIIAVSQVTPGPIAINSASFIGYKIDGLVGAIVATIGVTIVSFVLVIIIAHQLKKFEDSQIVKHVFLGLRPAVLALIASAAITVGQKSIVDLKGVLIAITVFVSIYKLKIHPILSILGAGFLGYCIY